MRRYCVKTLLSLDIIYQLEGDATNATVTGLPAGVSFSVLSGIVTISGTPTDDITSTTVYDYTITTTGSPCSGDTTGTITLDPDDDLTYSINCREQMHKYFVKQNP